MAKISDVIEGLKILAKHSKGGLDSQDIGADHDVIYAGPSVEEGELPQQDREALEKLNWHYSKENECWARFV